MQPLEITSVSPIQARLHNLLNNLGVIQIDHLPLGGDKMTITPVPAWEATNAGQPLSLVIGEEWCQVTLNKRRWISVLPNPVPGFTPQTLPEHMQDVILRRHCEELIAVVGRCIDMPVYWPDWVPDAEERIPSVDDDMVTTAFKVHRNGQQMGVVTFSIPAQGSAIKSIARWVNRSIYTFDSLHTQQSLTCHFCCGELELSPQELMDLEAGDILLLPREASPWQLTLAGHAIAGLAHTDVGWELVSVGFTEHRDGSGEENMSDADAGSGHPLNWNRVSSLNVPLRFELGEKQLTIAELQQLRPGMVITSDIDISQPVLIYQGDNLFGRGVLMDVGGQLGIQVTSLTSESRSAQGNEIG